MGVETLGNYELEGLLGEGGIGQVYAAQDKVLGRRVAIKMLRQELSRDHSFVERFYNEAKSLANLNHTNITTLYALHVEGGEAFMVMELVHGQTLEALLARAGRLTLRDSLAILAQAVPGIRYAHRRGIIHRDLKPANLMLTDDGVVKIMDFGIARVRGSEHLTRVGEFCGTFVYASPEQIRGEEVDERSDLYSLAIVLYRMLAGSPPFRSDNEYALMTAQLQTPPPPLAGHVPDLDAATEAVLLRALAKQREDRFASVEEFGRAIGAMALRGESLDLLQQLYAQAFAPGDPEATRIFRRHVPVIEPTPPSTRPRDTGDWRPPPALAGSGIGGPQPEARAATRRPVLAEAPASAAGPTPQQARRGFSRRWLAAAALVVPLLLAAGYFVVSREVPTPLSTPPPAAGIARPPSPHVKRAETPPAATPAEITRPQTRSRRVTAAITASPPPAPAAAAKEEPPAPPPAPVASAKQELPTPAPPPVPAPPPAPVPAAKQEPPAPPVIAAKQEPSAPPPPAPVVAAVKPEPPVFAPPPPAPVAAAKQEPPPAPAAGAKQEPPPPAPVAAAKEASSPPVHTPQSPSSPRDAPGRLASIEPERGLPEPEGQPDLQGRVTGAKGLDEIEVAARWIKIYGIVDRARGAEGAQHADALVRYLRPSHNHIVCYRKAADTYRCYSNGQDIARLALEDGMAQLAPNAPPEYRTIRSGRH